MKLKNTYAFDHVAIGYLQCLFVCCVVRTAASHEKRAQDKTTVRKSEFTSHSDSLSLSKTAKTDNALAAVTTTSTCKRHLSGWLVKTAPPTRPSVSVPDTTILTPPIKRWSVSTYPPTPAGGVNHLFDHRYEFDPIGAITRRTGKLKDFTENITYDHLDRMTDANLIGASIQRSKFEVQCSKFNVSRSQSGFSVQGMFQQASARLFRRGR